MKICADSVSRSIDACNTLKAMVSVFRLRCRKLVDYLWYNVKKKNGVLVYVGLHRGDSFRSLIHKYEICYGFEANPELFTLLQDEFRWYRNVKLFNVAVADYDGEIEFNISNNDGASSSIGHFEVEWENYKSGQIRFDKVIRVSCVNLFNFLTREGVAYIDDYVSDIQGMDLEVLKTLKPLIQSRRIGSISCEVTKDDKRNIYSDLPANNESGFHELLKDNYLLVAKGWGVLRDNRFDDVPEEWWEMDCKWRLK